MKDRLRELKKNGLHRYIYLVLGRDRSYFEKKHWFYQKVIWNLYHQHARVFDWQHICYVWWTCFSTNSRHTHGYKLCSSSRRLVPLFAWGRLLLPIKFMFHSPQLFWVSMTFHIISFLPLIFECWLLLFICWFWYIVFTFVPKWFNRS